MAEEKEKDNTWFNIEIKVVKSGEGIALDTNIEPEGAATMFDVLGALELAGFDLIGGNYVVESKQESVEEDAKGASLKR